MPFKKGQSGNPEKQFSKTNQPAHRGRKISIKNQLKELMLTEGEMLIEKAQVVDTRKDGSVVIKLPTETLLAMKLSAWALSKKGANSLKAIQMIMEQIDGKPKQAFSFESDEPILPVRYTIIANKPVNE